MNILTKAAAVMFCACALACSGTTSNTAKTVNTPSKPPAASPTPGAAVPKNGDYPGTGKVTKIGLDLGSVELDHEEIKGVMPRMIMEFYVSDKKLLNGLKVGDQVDFTLRYKDASETIVDIKKK